MPSFMLLYIACLFVGFVPFIGASRPAVQTSCVEHFLNGQHQTQVLPIGYGSQIFNLECVMPRSNFPDLLVETTVRSALEKPYTLLKEKRTIGYQVSDWDFLRKMVETQKCEQTLHIDWSPLDLKGDVQAFKIESITGNVHEFVANMSGVTHSTTLNAESGLSGILHLTPTGNSTQFTAKVSVSPLRCREQIIKSKECAEFELNSAQDKVIISTSDTKDVSFSFRTDLPGSGFLRLLSHTGSSVDVRLQEGYFLTIDKILFPVSLLADGNYHAVRIDLKNKMLTIDGETNISIDQPQLKAGIKEVEVRLNGTITAIRLDDNVWQCSGSKYLNIRSSNAVLRRICPIGEDSFCNCKGPASIFSTNGLEAPKCSQKATGGFTLKRNPSKNAFFYFDKTAISQSISMVFKTEANSGLVMFGQRRGAGASWERFQVYYVNDKLLAAACLKEGSQWSRCTSCQITRPAGFATNDWMRVTLFNQSSYLHMVLDDQICKLSQANQFRVEQFYKAPDSESFLFLGGTYYKKNYPESLAKDGFDTNFLDITAQKIPSIRGCINEIRLDGAVIDMEKQFNKQSTQFLKGSVSKNEFFAIEKGCNDCSLDCGDGVCRIGSDNQQICDCSNGFAGWSDNAKCDSHNVNSYWLNSTLSIELNDKINTKLNQHVTKVWTLLRFPAIRKDKVKLFEFGRFQVSVENYGKNVFIEAERDGISKKFDVDSRDERLHLVSIEAVDSVFSSSLKYKLRVDNQVQEISFDYIMTDTSVSIIPVANGTANNFGGCLAGLYFALNSDRDFESYNVIKELGPKLDPLLMYHDTCGIPNLLQHSPLGFVSDYDPSGRSQQVHKSGGSDDDFPWILLILAIIVLLLIGCFIFAIFWNKHSKRTYKVMEKGNKQTEIIIEETRPLCQVENQSDDRPIVTGQPNGADKVQKAPAIVTKDEL